MFRMQLDNTTPLDERTSRRQHDITIYFHMSHGGLGDVASALKLASGLKKELPRREVTLYFGRQEDFDVLKTLDPTLDLSHDGLWIGDVYVRQLMPESMYRICRESNVALFTPIAQSLYADYDSDTWSQEGLNPELLRAPINCYIQEYDVDRHTINIHYMRKNTRYTDMQGNTQITLSSGFDVSGLGLHIHDIPQIEPTQKNKRRLLKKIGLTNAASIVDSLWTSAYYADTNQFGMTAVHQRHYRGLKHVQHSMSSPGYLGSLSTAHRSEKITVFDFSGESFEDTAFTHTYIEDGTLRVVHPEPKPGNHHHINIMHVGHKQSDVFREYLAISELPVLITGDASLSEAISLRKRFIYQAPRWKSDLADEVLERSSQLERAEDIRKLHQLFGVASSLPDQMLRRSDFEKFYESLKPALSTAHAEYNAAMARHAKRRQNLRDKVLQSPEQYIDKKKFKETIEIWGKVPDWRIEEEVMNRLGQEYKVRERTSKRIVTKTLAKQGLKDQYLHELLLKHCQTQQGMEVPQKPPSYKPYSERFLQPPQWDLLFTDPGTQTAFDNLLQLLHTEANLAKNLAEVIRQLETLPK